MAPPTAADSSNLNLICNSTNAIQPSAIVSIVELVDQQPVVAGTASLPVSSVNTVPRITGVGPSPVGETDLQIKEGRLTAFFCTDGWFFGITQKKSPLRVKVSHYTDDKSKVREYKIPMEMPLPSKSHSLIAAYFINEAPKTGCVYRSDVSMPPIRRGHDQALQKAGAIVALEKKNDQELEEEIARREAQPSREPEVSTVDVFNMHHPDDDDIIESFPVPAGSSPDQILAELTKVWSHHDEIQHFCSAHQGSTLLSCQSLPVAAHKGALLRTLAVKLPAELPQWALLGLKPSTHKEHLRYLTTIRDHMPAGHLDKPLTQAIAETLHLLHVKREWKWSTTLKAAASLQGAFSLLPLYFKNVGPITLTQSPDWREVMRYLSHQCKEERPQQPVPASITQVLETVRLFSKEGKSEIAMALLVGWLTASRLGCILQLNAEDITFHSDSTISVTFRRGKGVRARGPYTVHCTKLPADLLQLIKTYVETRRIKLFGRSTTGTKLKDALRRVSPDLEQRSIRRGALQAMAQSGVSEETLMRYSGHTRVETLRRYLNWNLVNSKVASEMQEAGAALLH